MFLLRLLAHHLLGFNGLHELPAERKVGDGDVVLCEVEVRPMLDELGLDPGHCLLALAQQFLGVVLGHDKLEDLVLNRRQDPLVEVGPLFPVTPRSRIRYSHMEATAAFLVPCLEHVPMVVM